MYLVMFDVDGTLTESYEYDRQAYADAFADATSFAGVNTDWRAYRHVTSHGITCEAIRHHRGCDATTDDIKAVEFSMLSRLQSHYEAHPEQFSEVAGASAYIQRLQARDDAVLAIATGCWLSEARFKLQASGIDVSGIAMASSEDADSRSGIMAAAEKRAHEYSGCARFRKIIYFGDGVWDVMAAAELNYGFIGIGTRLSQLKEAGAVHLFRDYRNDHALDAAMEISGV